MFLAALNDGKVDVKRYQAYVQTSIEALVRSGEVKLANASQLQLVQLLLEKGEYDDAVSNMKEFIKRVTLDLDVRISGCLHALSAFPLTPRSPARALSRSPA